MRFEVLGPVRGWHGQTELDLGSPQQRAVLAMLLLARGRQVSLGGLVNGIWGDRPPRAAEGTIRTYVSRLRTVFAKSAGQPGELIVSVGDGYLLRLGQAALDLDVFEERVSAARAARHRRDAARFFDDALGLWNGDTLAGIPGPYADARRVPLAELRLAATEAKLAAEIAIGEHAVAIAELRALVADHPFREGLGELLMLALYRSGRRAEALHVFDSLQQRLGGELGIDPGPSLRVMHEHVMQADRRLMASDPCPVHLAAVAASMVAQRKKKRLNERTRR
jgi:DNA-binding SARP family transcriptional activator